MLTRGAWRDARNSRQVTRRYALIILESEQHVRTGGISDQRCHFGDRGDTDHTSVITETLAPRKRVIFDPRARPEGQKSMWFSDIDIQLRHPSWPPRAQSVAPSRHRVALDGYLEDLHRVEALRRCSFHLSVPTAQTWLRLGAAIGRLLKTLWHSSGHTRPTSKGLIMRHENL
jgi:hypothetical protein